MEILRPDEIRFYPAVREAIDDEDLMEEAEVEHAGAKNLVSQIDHAMPGTEQYDAKVTVLGAQVEHHVREEEGQMFPKVREAKLDLEALGKRMLARKDELMAGVEA